MRALLPALTRFEFKGFCEYLEDFVARIDAPLLDDLNITFFYQFIFNTPQLAPIIGRDEANVKLSDRDISVTLSCRN
jgi:hypothetical protein